MHFMRACIKTESTKKTRSLAHPQHHRMPRMHLTYPRTFSPCIAACKNNNIFKYVQVCSWDWSEGYAHTHAHPNYCRIGRDLHAGTSAGPTAEPLRFGPTCFNHGLWFVRSGRSYISAYVCVCVCLPRDKIHTWFRGSLVMIHAHVFIVARHSHIMDDFYLQRDVRVLDLTWGRHAHIHTRIHVHG